MIENGTIVCDGCHRTITKITAVPEGGWPQMHNLCSDCFDKLWKSGIQRV
jgi:hypothetical protein